MWSLFIVNLITYTQDPSVAEVLVAVVRGAIVEAHAVRVVSAVLRRRPEPAGSR